MLCDLFSWSVCRHVHPSSKGLLLLSSSSMWIEMEVFVWTAYSRGCCSNTNEDRGWLTISVASTCAGKHMCIHVQNLVGDWMCFWKQREGLRQWQKGLCWHKNTVPYGLFTALVCFLSVFLQLLLSVWICVGFPVPIHGCAWFCVKYLWLPSARDKASSPVPLPPGDAIGCSLSTFLFHSEPPPILGTSSGNTNTLKSCQGGRGCATDWVSERKIWKGQFYWMVIGSLPSPLYWKPHKNELQCGIIAALIGHWCKHLPSLILSNLNWISECNGFMTGEGAKGK